MLNDLQNELDASVRKIAESNIIKKLNEQGLNRSDIDDEKFEHLVGQEIEIVKNDGKKVGLGMAIGVGLSFLMGGIF